MNYSIIRVVFEFPPIIGGSVTHIVELSKAINPFLEKQIIIAPAFKGYSKFDSDFNIRVIRLSLPKALSFREFALPFPALFLYSYKVVIKLKHLIKRNCDIDLIHVHGTMLGSFIKFFMKLFSVDIPVIVMQHGYPGERSRGHYLSWILSDRLIQIFSPNYYLLLDDGTDIDRITKTLDGIKKKISYKIVYHGIDTDLFAPSNPSNQTFTILFPHRLEYVKRPDLAFMIFDKFLREIPNKDAKLIIFGDKSSISNYSLNNYVSDNIEFVGLQPISGLIAYLKLCDAAIGTSLESNMNRAIQEAMASAKPVVVFNSGGSNRLIKDAINGFLVEPEDITEFVNKLKLIYFNKDLGKLIGNNARTSILQERNWDSRIKRELEAYRTVLNP